VIREIFYVPMPFDIVSLSNALHVIGKYCHLGFVTRNRKLVVVGNAKGDAACRLALHYNGL
jgi:hypothetical protein